MVMAMAVIIYNYKNNTVMTYSISYVIVCLSCLRNECFKIEIHLPPCLLLGGLPRARRRRACSALYTIYLSHKHVNCSAGPSDGHGAFSLTGQSACAHAPSSASFDYDELHPSRTGMERAIWARATCGGTK
jgi:hypothetical protein